MKTIILVIPGVSVSADRSNTPLAKCFDTDMPLSFLSNVEDTTMALMQRCVIMTTVLNVRK